MRRYAAFALCAFIWAGGLLIVLPSPGAVAEATPNAIRVSPDITDLPLKQGQTSASVSMTVTNLTSSSISVTMSARDFGALNESGSVGFYGSSYNPKTNPHSLQTVMSFSPAVAYLPAHGSQTVIANLTDLDSLAPGGHFGAALVMPGSPLATATGPKVSVRPSVASLIFLVTADGGTQILHLLPLQLGVVRFELPSQTYIGFHNAGNTQSAVRGQLTLYGPNGDIVGTTVINPGSGLVLPGTSRVFGTALPLQPMKLARPGIYRMTLQYRSDSQTGFTTVSLHFYYINLYIFLPVVAAIVLIIYIGKWHGRRTLQASSRAAHTSARVVKKLRRKRTPLPEPPKKKRKHRQIQG